MAEVQCVTSACGRRALLMLRIVCSCCTCIMREIFEISKHHCNFNCEDAYGLSRTWIQLFSLLCTTTVIKQWLTLLPIHVRYLPFIYSPSLEVTRWLSYHSFTLFVVPNTFFTSSPSVGPEKGCFHDLFSKPHQRIASSFSHIIAETPLPVKMVTKISFITSFLCQFSQKFWSSPLFLVSSPVFHSTKQHQKIQLIALCLPK